MARKVLGNKAFRFRKLDSEKVFKQEITRTQFFSSNILLSLFYFLSLADIMVKKDFLSLGVIPFATAAPTAPQNLHVVWIYNKMVGNDNVALQDLNSEKTQILGQSCASFNTPYVLNTGIFESIL
jgi:hypothetical protein